MKHRYKFTNRGSNSGWYSALSSSVSDDVNICLRGVRVLFDTGKSAFDIVVTDKKPRGDDYYTIKKSRLGSVWNIADAKGTEKSPWLITVDRELSLVAKGKTKLYIFLEA